MMSNKEKGGYDVEFVDNEPNDVTCSICLFVLREPMQAEQCGHRFCKSCIVDVINSQNGAVLCPEDRRPINVFKDKGKEREILNILVKCTNNKNGCAITKELRELENHLQVCEYQTIPCPIEGCEDQFQRKFLDDHKKKKHSGDRLSKIEEVLRHAFLEIDKQKKRIESQNQKIESQNHRIASQNQLIQSQNQKIESLTQYSQSLYLNLQAHSNDIVVLKEKSNVLEGKNQVFHDTYVWEIRDFERKFEQSYYKEPQIRRFFTSEGYKIVARAYLNGVGKDWGKWMNLFLGLEEGPFDNTLKWPMAAKISVCLLFQGKERNSYTFDSKRKEHTLYKPNDWNDYTTGCVLANLNEIEDYVENDTLTIKITVTHG